MKYTGRTIHYINKALLIIMLGALLYQALAPLATLAGISSVAWNKPVM